MADSQMTAQTEYRLANGLKLGGSPSKYTPALIQTAKEYLETFDDSCGDIPTFEGLALALGITRETLQIWAKDKNKRELSYLVSQLRMIQHQKLVNGGLNSKYNSNITKLILGTHHGYTDGPQNNQGNQGITVNVNRRGVTVQAGGQSVTVDTEKQAEGTTIEHDPD